MNGDQAKAWEKSRRCTEAERDRIRRLFNRLDAAVTHHKRAEGFPDSHDEALYKARDKILSDYHQGKG